MLRQRVMAAVLALPMLFFLLWLNWYLRTHGSHDDLPILLITTVIAGVSGWEASHIIKQRYEHAGIWNGVYAALIIPFLVHSIHPDLHGATPVSSLALLIDSLGATATVMLLFLAVWADIEQRGRTGAMENLYAVGTGLYLGITTTFLILLAQTPFHEMTLLYIFVVIFSLDTAAYFGGKCCGGPHLAPKISPRKTWSGALFGLLGAVIVSLIFAIIPAPPGTSALGALIPWWGLALIGLCVGISGQIGDLLESALKRWGGVKDSGSALPGHGGFLDRFDSLFLAAPVAYLLLRLFLNT